MLKNDTIKTRAKTRRDRKKKKESMSRVVLTWEPVTVTRVQIVRQIDRDEHSARRRVDRHVVRRVIQKFGASVPLYIVRVEVTPSQLHVDPVLVTLFFEGMGTNMRGEGGNASEGFRGSEQCRGTGMVGFNKKANPN